MALTYTAPPEPPIFNTTIRDDRPTLPPPPPVITTPSDPWPRPYYIENGLRRVAPYHYTYNTFCKQRWRGRGILDIFSAEFRDRSREYYKEAIEDGRIYLNGKPTRDLDQTVANGDIISHTLHRHEPPVTAQDIRVIHESDDMIVIDKPAGVPVHPAGRYKFNSVVEIMRAERAYSFNPLPCNRLDRLTSGVMFIGKTSKEAEEISAKLRGRTVRKEYVARVKGRFPDGEGWDGDEMRGGLVKCEEAILQVSPILGLNRARASGKAAKTLFRRVAYFPPQARGKSERAMGVESEGYSIVHCLPLTGRTHQIRVHLQFLGHPISNDPIYSNRKVFGAALGKGDSTGEDDEQIKEALGRMGKFELVATDAYNSDTDTPTPKPQHPPITQTQQITASELEMQRARDLHEKYGPTADYKPLHHGTLHAGSPTISPVDGEEENEKNNPIYARLLAEHDEAVEDYNRRKGEKLTGEVCSICNTPLYSDPGPQELGIYLHALAYASVGGEWRYTSPLPEWAKRPPASLETEDHELAEMWKKWPSESPQWNYGDETTVKETEGISVVLEQEEAEKKNNKAMKKNRELEQEVDEEYAERLARAKEKKELKKERKKRTKDARKAGVVVENGETNVGIAMLAEGVERI